MMARSPWARICVPLLILALAVGAAAPSACDPPPPAYPDASTTGTHGALDPYTGGDIRVDGTLVENKLIDTSIGVYADDVTFRNCKFVFTGTLDSDFTMVLVQGRGARFEDVEFDGQDNVARAIEADNDTGDAGVTVLRANLHNVGNGVESQGPLHVEDSYIHAIWEPPGTDWHADGIQTPRSSDDVTIRHNTIITDVPATSAINVQGSDTDPAERMLVEDNLLAGGGYTLYAGPGGPSPNEYVVRNNHFSTRVYPNVGDFGPITTDYGFDNTVFTGNVIDETGEPVTP